MKRLPAFFRHWFDNGPHAEDAPDPSPQRVDWLRCIPFFAIHLGCLGVIWTGTSLTAVLVAVGLYFGRMFAVSTHSMPGHSSSPKSFIALAFCTHGFHTTVESLPSLSIAINAWIGFPE